MTSTEAGARADQVGSARPGPAERLRRKLRREGLGAVARTAWRRLSRPLYERMDLIYIDRELASWTPRLLKRASGTSVTEVHREALDAWRELLGPEECRYFEEQFTLGSRLFVAVRRDRLAGIIAGNTRYTDPRWRVTCEVAPDELILFRVFVAPEFRRGAVGGVLTEAVLQIMKDEGLRRMVGVIHEDNRPSLVLAENMGMEQYQRLRIHRFLRRLQTAPRVVEGRKQAFSGRASS